MLQFLNAKSLGYKGEALAAEFLRSKGYEILHSNFTVRGGEIDLVARTNSVLVFVEVKTRTSDSFGSGDESMDKSKKRRMHRAIQRYLDRYFPESEPDYRVDLVEIDLDMNKGAAKHIEHFEDIEM